MCSGPSTAQSATHFAAKSVYSPSNPGRLVHADIVGPFQMSTSGFRYMLVFTDDHSRYKSVYLLKKKSDALPRVRSYVAKIKALSGLGPHVHSVGHLRHCDNAGEFLSYTSSPISWTKR